MLVTLTCCSFGTIIRGSCIFGSSCDGVLLKAWLIEAVFVGTVLEPVLKTLMS